MTDWWGKNSRSKSGYDNDVQCAGHVEISESNVEVNDKHVEVNDKHVVVSERNIEVNDEHAEWAFDEDYVASEYNDYSEDNEVNKPSEDYDEMDLTKVLCSETLGDVSSGNKEQGPTDMWRCEKHKKEGVWIGF